MSHSFVADAGDLFIENAKCRQIVEFGQRHDLAVPPPLHAAKPHSEIFDPPLVRRESEENKPSFALPYGRAKRERAKLNRKRYE
jgi:hypothetical protein